MFATIDACSVAPPPVTVTVGFVVYPLPAFVIVTVLNAPAKIVQVAVACVILSPVIVIVGAVVYPVPA